MTNRIPNQGWLEREGVRLRYLEWEAEAGGDPALFLLHGLSSNATYWQRLVDQLPARRIVALDQRSHGRSDRPPTGYDMGTLTADAAQVIEATGLGRPLVAGHSWGATIALELVAARPDLASGLAFLDGPASPMNDRLTWDQVATMMQPPLPRHASLADAAASAGAYLEGAWGEDLMGYVEDSVFDQDGAFISTLTGPVRLEILRGLYLSRPDLLWGAVPGPLLLAVAGGDPEPFASMKRQAARSVAEIAPDALIRWFDSPHDIPLHQPAPLATEIERLCLRAGLLDLAERVAKLGGDWVRSTPLEGWSTKDLLAHLSSTHRSLAKILTERSGESAATSSDRSEFDPDRWNISQLRRRQELPAESLQEEFATASVAIDAALAEIDLGGTISIGAHSNRPLPEAIQGMINHQRQHLEQLLRALAQGHGSSTLIG